MSGPGQNAEMFSRTRSELPGTLVRSGGAAHSEQRLSHIHEISNLLLRSLDVAGAVPHVLEVLARSLPLKAATFTQDEPGPLRVVRWRASTPLPARQYLVDLPLAVDHQTVFGTLQLEGAAPFADSDLQFAEAVVNQLALAIERQGLVDATEREQRLLAEVGNILTSSLDRRGTLAALARRMVPQFADLFVVDEVDGDGKLARAHVVFADEARQRRLAERVKRLAPQTAGTPQARVLESGRPLLHCDVIDPAAEDIAPDAQHVAVMLEVGTCSMMVVPLSARGRKIGVLTFVSAESGRKYRPRDLANAVEFADRIATGLDNSWLYEQAQTATRARDDLLAIVSHDLKNPLGSILMSANQMLAVPPGEDRRASRRHPELIVRAVHRMNRLIADLLDISSIEEGHFTVGSDMLRVEPLVVEALEVMQPVAASKGVMLRGDVASATLEVCGDAARLQQVLSNLLGNAIKFTPRGGTVILRAVSAGTKVLFSVRDTGPGIPRDELPHLFERFWQAKRTASLGSGLGLFIVRGIVGAHGGEAWVESTEGQGSSFFFTIPAAPPRHEDDAQREVGPVRPRELERRASES